MHEARLEAIDSSALQRVVRLLEGDCRALLEGSAEERAALVEYAAPSADSRYCTVHY